MSLYHGSKNKFERFSYNCIRENGTSEGIGFYLTNNKNIAERYGANGYLYEFEILEGKELSSEEITLTDSELRKLLLALDKKEQILSNWGDINWEGVETVLAMAIENLKDDTDDIELISGLCNIGGFETVLTALYEELGYTHARVEANWGDQTIYVVFVNECLKLNSVTKI